MQDFRIQKTNNKNLTANHSITNKRPKVKIDLIIQILMGNLTTMQIGALAMILILNQLLIKINLKNKETNFMVVISIKKMITEITKIKPKRVLQETKT